jgi:inward rectifier potassium channel
MPDSPRPIRFTAHKGRLPNMQAVGRQRSAVEDLYHWVLTRTWAEFFGVVALTFVGINTAFALVYLAAPGAIANARPGSFEDAFFFSVHTMGTIGYGTMAPANRFGNVVVAVEALVGMVSVALMTGVTFAKFARPTAKILFSDKMVIHPRNGVPHLCFRMANWRHNQIVEAQVSLILLLTERTTEGDTLRRPMDLKLVRNANPLFSLTWLVMHEIDASSPFFGPGALDRLRAQNAELFLSLTGYDETIMQTIHARYAYALDDILESARFADILKLQPDGTRVLDYTKFHEVVEVPPAP